VGVFGGEKALGANLAMKQIAEKALAAGKDPEEVRRITGWFKGMEGKPRFEISDKGMVIDKSLLNVGPDWTNTRQGTKLGDVVKHTDLLEKYPELADVNLNLRYSKDLEHKGNFIAGHGAREAELNITGRDYDDALDVLSHEIQHWVQQKEGFASGSNPQTETLKAMQASPASEALFGKRAEEIGFERYQRHAGEIEARDVSTRRTWDVEMREAVPPDLRKDAIIRWGDKGAEEIALELLK
jgi:hypothetical protein